MATLKAQWIEAYPEVPIEPNEMLYRGLNMDLMAHLIEKSILWINPIYTQAQISTRSGLLFLL